MCRTIAWTFALAGLILPKGATAQEPPSPWVAYLSSEEEFAFVGSLDVVRADGSGGSRLLEEGVLEADVGPGGVVYAAQEQPPEMQDAGAPSSLLRIPIEQGDTEAIVPEEEEDYFLGVAASGDGRLAYFRQVSRAADPPEFLVPALDGLVETSVPILVPTEEPEATGGVVVDASEDFYEVLFTNDPEGELSHAEQHNVSIGGARPGEGAPPDSTSVAVRDTEGWFSCGASACFLSWDELDTTYTVGEFGDPEAAAAFAESLEPIEEIAGVYWREGGATPTPELVVRDPGGEETYLEKLDDFCECAFLPLDWASDGQELLVLTSSEGYTTLHEYRADGSGEPRLITEGSVHEGGQVLDAAYGPDGLLLLIGGEGGPPGTLQEEDGSVLLEDALSFDVSGSLLAYVDAGGGVNVRDLGSGEETSVGEGAFEVSIGPAEQATTEPTQTEDPARPADASSDEGLPVAAIAAIAGGGLALVAGAILLLLARRRSRRPARRG